MAEIWPSVQSNNTNSNTKNIAVYYIYVMIMRKRTK